MLFRKSLIAAACTLALGSVQALAGSAEEAAKLGGAEFNPVGAEKAGNADGSIPAWNPAGPANFKADGAYADPYADEAKLFTIDATNIDQYADQVPEGVKALIAAGKGFSMDVYPSHRDQSYADWVVRNTKYNAEHVNLVADGQKVEGNKPGVPFPFPESGLEAIWNHMVRVVPSHEYNYDSYYVTSTGKPILSTTAEGFYNMVGFRGDNVDKIATDLPWLKLRINYEAPARRAGEILLVHEPGADFTEGKGRKAWQYLVGQRRVRLAPAVAFDTPNPGIAGTSTYDDSFIYNGSPERFSWTLVGKKEMYIPYNNNKFVMETEIADALGENFIKPEYVRWEKHRVWVVEADLKDGKRHIYKKRRFYLDEDTWASMASDAYDARDNLWRVQLNYPVNLFDQGKSWTMSYTGYDILQGIYNVNTKPTPGKLKFEITKSDKFFSPKGMARGGIR